MKRFATELDFLANREFCAFYINIDADHLEVHERGNAKITKDARNGELRLLWLGSINQAPIGELRFQSASMQSWSGYYVDYAHKREEAKLEAMRLARQQHIKMMTQLDTMLARMQSTELVFVEKPCQCKC